MRNSLLLIIGLMLASITAQAGKLSTNTTVRSCMFLHPAEGAYVETYITAGANALTLVKNEGQYTGGVEVSIVVLDGATVINFAKYTLAIPPVMDSANVQFSIMDQKRLFIPNKTLTVETTISDINDATNNFLATEIITSLRTDAVQISDLQLVDAYKQVEGENNFTKNGVEMLPYPINFYPNAKQSVIFYGEIYNADKYLNNEPYMVSFSIREAFSDEINNTFFQYIKAEPSPVYSFLREISIKDLPSGNYNLIVEVRNKKNELVAQKKLFFQRVNSGAVNAWENIQLINTAGTFTESYTDEQLNYFLDVIRPRASQSDVNIIESLTPRVDSDMKKKFLYNFWVERNPADPYGEWKKYLVLVKEANDGFSTPSREGYKTDRGRVYLQYGRPYDRVTSVNEPGAYPYEVWFYTTLPDKQTNIGFAFYEPSGVSNDYQLLHSNARGELHDPRWKIRIYETVASPQEVLDLDNTNVEDKLSGHRAIDQYEF